MPERKQTFDTVSSRYNTFRPGYPPQFYNEAIAMTSLTRSAKILEIGCGTGQATKGFLDRGFSVHAVEPGVNLAATAVENLRQYPGFTLSVSAFEAFRSNDPFDLIFAASSFHWIDPAIGYPHACGLLKPGGWMLTVWNSRYEDGIEEPLRSGIRNIYDRYFPENNHRGPEIDRRRAEFENSDLFEPIIAKEHHHTVTYDADAYIGLIGTYSDHILLDPPVFRALSDDLRNLIVAHGNRLTIPYIVRAFYGQKPV